MRTRTPRGGGGGGIFPPLFPFDYLTSFCLSFFVGGCIEVVRVLRCRASGVLIVASISCPRRLTLIVGALRGAVMRSRFPNPTVPCCWKHRCAGTFFFFLKLFPSIFLFFFHPRLFDWTRQDGLNSSFLVLTQFSSLPRILLSFLSFFLECSSRLILIFPSIAFGFTS